MASYECDNCGVCCGTYRIFASESDAAREPRIASEGRRVPLHLATPAWTYQIHPLPFHQTCCFLDGDKLCEIYETRPDVCRAFGAGDRQCQEARRLAGLPPLEARGEG